MENTNMLSDIEIIDNFINKTQNETIKWKLVKGTFPTKDYYVYELNETLSVELFYYNFVVYTYDGAEIPSIGYKLAFSVGSNNDHYIKEIYDENMGDVYRKLKELFTLVETKQHNLDKILKQLFGI